MKEELYFNLQCMTYKQYIKFNVNYVISFSYKYWIQKKQRLSCLLLENGTIEE